MWQLYSWTNVIEIAKRSTTGLSLQCQPLIDQTSDKNYGNHQLEDVLMSTNSQNLDVKRNEEQCKRIDSLNKILKMANGKYLLFNRNTSL